MTKETFKELKSNKGFLRLGDLELDEKSMQFIIDILDMSDELKEEIENGIEAAKEDYVEEWDEYYKKHPEHNCHNRIWSDKPVKTFCKYLLIDLEESKPIKYTVVNVFEDGENELLETSVRIPVDLSAYENELKTAIIKVMVDKFFSK